MNTTRYSGDDMAEAFQRGKKEAMRLMELDDDTPFEMPVMEWDESEYGKMELVGWVILTVLALFLLGVGFFFGMHFG